MVSLTALWLPILLSAAGVFIASSVIHMALKYHASDYGKVPNEEAVLDALRATGIGRGAYMFPHCASHKEGSSPEMQEKFKRGPVGTLVLMEPGSMNMGKYLSQWFVYTLVVSFFSGYLASRTVSADADYLAVFRIVGTTAFMAYGVGQISDSIWKAQPWSTTMKGVFDGLVYALVTAGFFGWLWP